MKNRFLIPLLLCALGLCAAISTPPEVVVKHHSYVSHYNPALREPDSVTWDLSPSMVQCTPPKRKDLFTADPAIPGSAKAADYTNSGYDKGHLFSYDDAACSALDRVECFYMSNMLPQLHPFNAGDWKTLEVQERAFAKTTPLHIVAGGFGTLGKLNAGENIPAYMWKAIYLKGAWTVWIMPNSSTKSIKHAYTYWIASIHTFDLLSIAKEIASNSKKYSLD